MAVPVELEIFMKDLTKAGLQSVGKNVDDVENQTLQLISALKQVIAEQKKQLEVNKIAGVSYTQEAANIQALTGQVRGLEAGLNSLKKTKEEAAKTPSIDIDTEAVTRKTNNLKMQFSQVARELPSLAMGPQMFILAISNNLPMLADAIADVRKQNELLAASGQKGVPVWKQLAGAVFSWQTALVAAISLGIVYGKEIGNWVSSLFKAKKELIDTQKIQNELNKVQVEGGKSAAEEAAKLKILYEASLDTSKSMKERNKAVDELQKMYPSYFGKLSNEEILAGKASDAYDRLTKSIISSAKARAAMNKMVDEQGKILENEQKINDAYSRLDPLLPKLEAAEKKLNIAKTSASLNAGKLSTSGTRNLSVGGNVAVQKAQSDYDQLKKETDAIYEEIAGYRAAIYESNKISKELEKSIKVDDIVTEEKGSGTGSGKTDYASQLADARIRAQQTTEKLRIQIMQEGIAKRMALAKQEYDESVADIDKQERDMLAKMDQARKQGDNIPQSQYDEVKNTANTNRMLAEQVYNEKIYQIEQEYRDKATQSLIDYNKQYGTYQEKRLAIAMDYARKIAAAETEGEADVLTRERDDKLASLDFEEMKKGMDWEKIFGDLDRVSTDTLESLREKLKEYLEGIGDDISHESFKEVMDAFGEIDSELAGRSPFEAMKKGYEDYMSAMEEVRAAENLLQQTRMGGSVIVEEYDEDTGTLTRKLVTQAEAEERLRAAQDKRYSAQKSLTEAVNSIGQKGEAVVSAGNDIVDMLTALGISVPDAMQDVLGGLGTVMSSMASIDLTKPFSILTGITGTLKGIGQTIGGLFGLGSDSTERYEKLRESLEAMNELYDKIISKEKENISFGGGFGAMASAEKAQKALKAQIENLQQLASAASGAGSGLFKHSYGYRTNEAIGSGGYREISSLIGKNIDDVSDLFTLTGDELYEIMSQLPGVWNNIDGNIRQYLEDIVELKDESLEIQDALNEALTGVGRDSFYNSFIDQLADMETSWEDMCGNFEDELRKSILAGLVSSQYQSQIDALYNKWAEAARSGGKIDEKEAGNLRSEYQRIVKSLMNERDKMAETFGWEEEEEEDEGSSQSPSSGALTTMSQDIISTFEAIGRNMQTNLANTDKFVQEIRNTQKQDSQTLATIAGHTAHLVEIHDILSDMKLNGIQLK